MGAKYSIFAQNIPYMHHISPLESYGGPMEFYGFSSKADYPTLRRPRGSGVYLPHLAQRTRKISWSVFADLASGIPKYAL